MLFNYISIEETVLCYKERGLHHCRPRSRSNKQLTQYEKEKNLSEGTKKGSREASLIVISIIYQLSVNIMCQMISGLGRICGGWRGRHRERRRAP